MQNDQHIRNIVQQELAAQRYGFKANPSSLMLPLRTTGSVEFDSAKSYRFNVNFQPNLIFFYGNPYHTTTGTKDIHTFVFGSAALGQNLYFQPDTTSSVKVGGKLGIVQSSTMFMALASGSSSSFQGIASQEHLIDVELSGSVVARATVSGYSANSFTITVDALASGWTILGNYFVM